MIGYPYIQNLFQTILNSSKVIQGRFFLCPKWGSELSNPNIDEALFIGQTAPAQKLPGVYMMPPPKQGWFQYQDVANTGGTDLYDTYTIQLLFLSGQTAAGQNQQIQPNTINISTHTMFDTWHDMDRIAQNFMATLRQSLAPLAGAVIISDRSDAMPKVNLVSDIGQLKASGVALSFKMLVFPGCVMEDYASVPTAPALTDTHPIHGLS